MSRIVRLYPAAWRARYEPEFVELLATRPPSVTDWIDIFRGALDARAHPQVGPGTREPGSGVVEMRRAGAVEVLGGALWALAGLGFYGAPYVDELGYKDGGSVALVAAAAAALTGFAAVAVDRQIAARSVVRRVSAAAVVLGAIGLALPWPILLVGFFGIVIGTLLFGFSGASRLGPAYVLVGIGALLALGFNTEDGRALWLIPLGMAWVIAGVATFRGGPAWSRRLAPVQVIATGMAPVESRAKD